MDLKQYLLVNPPVKRGDYDRIGKIYNKSAEAVRSVWRKMKLKESGLSEQGVYKLINKPTPKTHIIPLPKMTTITIGAVSDTHICSTKAMINELHTFYHLCKTEGVKTILHAGDLIDGFGVYRGQENELTTFGADNQINEAIKLYPKVDGITTEIIAGNHDLSWWNRSGIDVVQQVANKRKDIEYLGQYFGDVYLGDLHIQLQHPDGGSWSAISEKARDVVRNAEEKNILYLVGHYHQQNYSRPRGRHVVFMPCFQGNTPFIKRHHTTPDMGGVILTIKHNKGKILEVSPRFINFD